MSQPNWFEQYMHYQKGSHYSEPKSVKMKEILMQVKPSNILLTNYTDSNQSDLKQTDSQNLTQIELA